MFFLTSLAFYLAARLLSCGKLAALIIALSFSYAPFRLVHLGQVQMLSLHWYILSIAGAYRYLATRRAGWLPLLAAFFLLQATTGLYLTVYLLISHAVIFGMAQGYRPLRGNTRELVLIGVTAVVTLLVAGVILWPYFAVRINQELQPRIGYSTVPLAMQMFLALPRNSFLWSGLEPRIDPRALSYFPNLVVLFFAGYYLIRTIVAGKRNVFFGLSAGSTILAFYLLGQGGTGVLAGLFEHTILGGLRVLHRFAIPIVLLLALMAAGGLDIFLKKFNKNRLRMVTLLLAVVLLENIPYVPTTTIFPLAPRPGIYSQVERLAGDGSAIVELPLSEFADNWNTSLDPLYMYYSIGGFYRMFNGYSGFFPKDFQAQCMILKTFPDPAALKLLRELRISLVVFHSAAFPRSPRERILRRISESPRLFRVEAYDNGDYLIRITDRVVSGDKAAALARRRVLET